MRGGVHLLYEPDTIVAISTPPGRGGIGIVRLSGPSAQRIAEPLFRLRNPLATGRARFGELLDADGNVLDEAVVTYFAAPNSYTSEDVVEIACHGSPVLLDFVVRACLGRGARLAQPGEFTQRAFLSGRLDLTQAEAVHDLIAAQTLHQARTAAAQLGGSVARVLGPTKQRLVHLIAELEAGIDFAEDDLDLMPQERISAEISAILRELQALAATYRYGQVVREGFTLAIVGRPNAGKSSLFNQLLERERAIVTPEPGTTRDPVSERLALGGIPVELVDTAGLRDTPDGEAEAMGIAKSRERMADADFVLQVVDAKGLAGGGGLGAEDEATRLLLAGRAHLVVLNKCDLVADRGGVEGAVWVSAKTGEGLEGLKGQILRVFSGSNAGEETALVSTLRQFEAVSEAVVGLERARAGAGVGVPHEMLLLDLMGGLEGLDRLTGATSADDILQLIFSTFCIGK
jgi:tRNA modification GTPase